jgi:hypothetical protein
MHHQTSGLVTTISLPQTISRESLSKRRGWRATSSTNHVGMKPVEIGQLSVY